MALREQAKEGVYYTFVSIDEVCDAAHKAIEDARFLLGDVAKKVGHEKAIESVVHVVRLTSEKFLDSQVPGDYALLGLVSYLAIKQKEAEMLKQTTYTVEKDRQN